jgi:hypothetical protein
VGACNIDLVDDEEIIAAQIGRPPRAFSRVVVRCPFGFPAVTEQKPYDHDGVPFPTSFYLTCPELVSALARLEAAGGVERWSERVRKSLRLRSSLRQGNRKQVRLRKELARSVESMLDGGASLGLGIGGCGSTDGLKCLHAHVAFALANPGYLLGEQIAGELERLWPDHCRARKGCGSQPQGRRPGAQTTSHRG